MSRSSPLTIARSHCCRVASVATSIATFSTNRRRCSRERRARSSAVARRAAAGADPAPGRSPASKTIRGRSSSSPWRHSSTSAMSPEIRMTPAARPSSSVSSSGWMKGRSSRTTRFGRRNRVDSRSGGRPLSDAKRTLPRPREGRSSRDLWGSIRVGPRKFSSLKLRAEDRARRAPVPWSQAPICRLGSRTLSGHAAALRALCGCDPITCRTPGSHSEGMPKSSRSNQTAGPLRARSTPGAWTADARMASAVVARRQGNRPTARSGVTPNALVNAPWRRRLPG